MSTKEISIKEIILGILVILSSTFVFRFWYTDIPLLVNGGFQNLNSFIPAIAGLCIAAAIFALGALFIRDRYIMYVSAILSVSIPYFFLDASSVVLGTLALSIFLLFFSVRRIRKEYALSLGFSTSKLLRDGLPLYFTVISLVISVFYLSEVGMKNAANALIPRPALDFTLRLLTKNKALTHAIGLPEINPDATIDEILKDFMRKEALKQGISPERVSEKDFIRAIAEQRSAFAEQYGITLNGNEKVGDVFIRAIQSYMDRLLGPYKEYLPFAAAAAFFLAFKTLTLPLYYITLVLVYILIKLLISAKILKRGIEKIDVERLELT